MPFFFKGIIYLFSGLSFGSLPILRLFKREYTLIESKDVVQDPIEIVEVDVAFGAFEKMLCFRNSGMSSTPWCILEVKNRGLVPDLCIDRSSSAVLADLPLAPVAVLDVVVMDYFLVINLFVLEILQFLAQSSCYHN